MCGPLKGVRPPGDFKARTDWILVFLYWFVHTCFALFASSARSSGSITDVLGLQTLQRENGSVLSVKTRWNNREEGDDINEPCSVFHRCEWESCDLHTASVVCVGQLSELHVRDLLWVAWPVLCDQYLAPWLLDIAWSSKTLDYEREHIINFYGICQLRGLFGSKEHFNFTYRKKSHMSDRSWNLHYRLIHDMHQANLYVLHRPFRA